MTTSHAAGTLLDVMLEHVRRTPDKRCMTFLENGESPADSCTFAELDRDARAVAAALSAQAEPGDRVLLLFPPGLDFIRGFIGCLYAGMVAVPAYPPRKNRGAERVSAIVGDADARVVLSTAEVAGTLPEISGSQGRLPVIAVAATTANDATTPVPWSPAWPTPDTLAFLQYTSGSTGTPKGVMVSHANLLHNLETVCLAFSMSERSVFVGWLPVFHDMGLIGQVLAPLYLGASVVLMAPTAFLQRPLRWLEAVSTYRGTISGAPNSAYELCLARTTPEERARLDLSSWTMAYNGAEPVREDTVRRFIEAFAPARFRPEQMQPTYGMAETVLFLTIQGAGTAPVFHRHGNRQLVSCGHAFDRATIRIVNPVTRMACDEGIEGEIWASSPAIAAGYFNNPAATAEVFGVALAHDDGARYYRTGDLGIMSGGHLFVTGREKDLIIVRGRNCYPQDLEASASEAVAGLRGEMCIAFGLDDGLREQVVVVVELPRELMRGDHQGIIDRVRARVATDHDVAPDAVVLVRTTTLPRTSSGKVQRRRCRLDYQQQQLDVVAQWRAHAPDDAAATSDSPAALATPTHDALRAWLVEQVAALSHRAPATVDAQAPLSQFGFDSVQTVALAGALQQRLGRDLPATIAYDYPTIDALASHLTGATARLTGTAGDSTTGRTAGSDDDVIAIVGLACRMPGADTPEAFWSLLEQGAHAITAPPADRDPALGLGGYLTDVSRFDAACFGISPHEAGLMDPQQRLLCEVTWEALERAGMVPSSLAGTRTGVFVGVSAGDYARLAARGGHTAEAHAATGNASSVVANRLSYLFDLRGPSWAVDTACSSSLVAVHHGCDALRAGTIDTALVGGVNVQLLPDLTTAFTRAGMLSPARRCRTFDAAADGYVRGEGAVMVVLKRLADAKRDGDIVWALLRGSAVNQDGRTHGLTAPNGPAQTAVVREALQRAGVTSAAVQLVETHGTGTALGDPIEVQALAAVLDDAPRSSRCFITSTKANIGHLEAAAGLAGLCKVVLALRHGVIPPQPGVETLNPRITLGETLAIPSEAQPWPAGRRIAGVSAFGFGGTNVHVIVEGAPSTEVVPVEGARDALPDRSAHAILALSARTPAALRALVQRMITWLEAQGDVPLAPLAHSWCSTRGLWAERMTVVARTTAEAVDLLRQNAPPHGRIAGALGDVTQLSMAEQDAAARFLGGDLVDWRALYPLAARRPDAPTYPFEPVRHWLPAANGSAPDAPVPLPQPSGTPAQGPLDDQPRAGGIRFGVMFFAANVDALAADGYNLLLDVARFADEQGFSSVWLPERHFTPLGGAYPAPAILHGALAMCTKRVRLHAGSVVAPLHHPVRIAEDWAVVDRLSNGRAGFSLATGWHPDDFALAPERYADRQAELHRTLHTVRALWRGEPWVGSNGLGEQTSVTTLPRPIQSECPVWITAAANPDSFERAGAAGANLLTHILDQDVDALAAKIARYRHARAAAGLDPATGQVTVMIHTFVGEDRDTIREEARAPFCQYIEANLGLLRGLAKSRGQEIDLSTLTGDDRAEFINFLYDRFAEQRGLIGTPESCLPLVQRLEAIGVNEVACLLDFGPAPSRVRASLKHLDRLRRLAADRPLDDLCYTRRWETPTSTRPALPTPVQLLTDAPTGPLAQSVRAAIAAIGVAVSDEGPALVLDLRAAEGSTVEGPECDADTAMTRISAAISTARAAGRDGAAPVLYVTRGGVAVQPDERVSPSSAAIWGVGRALQVEHPGQLAMLLDLDPALPLSTGGDAITGMLRTPPEDDMAALRGGTVLVPRLGRAAPPPPPGTAVRDGTVMITGGTGGIGLALAGALVEDGVRDLVLLARTPQAAYDTVGYRALQALADGRGARLAVHGIDVTDGTALEACFERLRMDGRPVTTVYHAAGVLDDATLDHQDTARIERVLAAKVKGGWLLRQLAERHSVGSLVFFSSVSALLPAPGQASYAAANAYLDGLAAEGHALGHAVRSINWGPWAEVGHSATTYGRAAHAQLASLGITPLSPAIALSLVRQLPARGAPSLIVAQVDWHRLGQADPLAARLPLVRALVQAFVQERAPERAPEQAVERTVERTPAPTPARASEPIPQTAPSRTATAIIPGPGAERHAWLFAHLARALGETLKRAADDPIPPRQPLFDLGLDSILALELRDRLEQELGIGLKPTVLFTYPTLETLVDHLLTLLPAERPSTEASDIEAMLRAALDSGRT